MASVEELQQDEMLDVKLVHIIRDNILPYANEMPKVFVLQIVSILNRGSIHSATSISPVGKLTLEHKVWCGLSARTRRRCAEPALPNIYGSQSRFTRSKVGELSRTLQRWRTRNSKSLDTKSCKLKACLDCSLSPARKLIAFLSIKIQSPAES